MNTTTQINNHEVWHVCEKCLEEFDLRKHAVSCPVCGHWVKIVDTPKPQ